MNDREYLDRCARDVRGRVRHGSRALWRELERSVGPRVRRNPRVSLAAGAVAGLLIGRVVAPGGGVDRGNRPTGPRGWIRSAVRIAMRMAILGAIRSPASPRGRSRGADAAFDPGDAVS